MEAVGPPPALQPAAWEPADVVAVQALAAGAANADQQRRALKWIIEACCDAYGVGWHPEGPHAASFVAGRRFAGMQIVKAVNMSRQLIEKVLKNG